MQCNARPCIAYTHASPYKSMQGYAKPCKSMQNRVSPLKSFQGHTSPFKSIQGHARPCRALKSLAIKQSFITMSILCLILIYINTLNNICIKKRGFLHPSSFILSHLFVVKIPNFRAVTHFGSWK